VDIHCFAKKPWMRISLHIATNSLTKKAEFCCRAYDVEVPLPIPDIWVCEKTCTHLYLKCQHFGYKNHRYEVHFWMLCHRSQLYRRIMANVIIIPPREFENPLRLYYAVQEVRKYVLRVVTYGIASEPNFMNFRPAILQLLNLYRRVQKYLR
jgi:hypothetical protein